MDKKRDIFWPIFWANMRGLGVKFLQAFLFGAVLGFCSGTLTCTRQKPKRVVVIKNLSSKKLINILEKDGWEMVRIVGSHHQFRHPTKPGTTTVPHPKKDLRIGTVKSILKQAKL